MICYASFSRNSRWSNTRFSAIWSVVETTVSHQIQVRANSGRYDSTTAGTMLTTIRSTEVASDGSVLPMPWNMLADTKVMPDATKLMVTTCR